MKQIKILGILIFTFSITLAFIFNYTSNKNKLHNTMIEILKEQKEFTQDISKNIFYIYKSTNKSTRYLDDSIKKYLKNITNKEMQLYKNEIIIKLLNTFYLHVQHFRDKIKIRSPYTNILLEKEVNDIYNTNLNLIIEFNKLIKNKQKHFEKTQNIFIKLQYLLFTALVLLLLYLFTKLKSLVTFVQEFLFKSKKIIKNSSIKELKPLVIDDKNTDTLNAENNFNLLISKINNGIDNSTKSIEYSHKSLEILELQVEELLNFIYDMNSTKQDTQLRKKEDAIIQSLEELCATKLRLKNLKDDLDNLISH